MTLLPAALAILFAWEFVLAAVPWSIPAWLQPPLIYGAALAYSWPDYRFALAVAGLTGLLHCLTIALRPDRGSVQMVPRPPSARRRTGRVPNLP